MDPTPASTKPPARPGQAPARVVPEWHPAWAREFADLYYAGTTCLFVLHGDVGDLTRLDPPPNADYAAIPEFLAAQLFGGWDLVLIYDLSQGLRTYAGRDGDRFRRMAAKAAEVLGEPKTWPRDPDLVLALIDQLVQKILLTEDPARRLSLGVIIEQAQFLTPSVELTQLAGPQGARLVRLASWAGNPYIKQCNIAFCLLCDPLAELNERLTSSAHVAAIEVAMPTVAERGDFIRRHESRPGAAGELGDFTPERLAELTGGLNLVNLDRLLAQAAGPGRSFDSGSLKTLKKRLIERQARGLVEFIEPPHSMDDFVGNDAVRERLIDDARLLSKGRLDVAPMGYLVCGPVGTGKTYLAECFAGSVGAPCVKMRNFRSKYVGETEGNLQQILAVLRAMGPVIVVIDEADAALGDRQGGGDSGTSSRVFSMIASQMGDTRYRGRLIWMLLTSRPELLPVDLKRQGRAEVHLPLFSPGTEAEVETMVAIMAKKNKTALEPGADPKPLAGRGLSGADLESIVLAAKRKALVRGRETIAADDLEFAAYDFIPSAQGLEKEKQELNAVLECTSIAFLPEHWRKRVLLPEGRAKLQERAAAIRRMIEA